MIARYRCGGMDVGSGQTLTHTLAARSPLRLVPHSKQIKKIPPFPPPSAHDMKLYFVKREAMRAAPLRKKQNSKTREKNKTKKLCLSSSSRVSFALLHTFWPWRWLVHDPRTLCTFTR